MFSTKDFRRSLIDIICDYYVVDISYPKVMYALLIFVQHFAFGITDTGIVPKLLCAQKFAYNVFYHAVNYYATRVTPH